MSLSRENDLKFYSEGFQSLYITFCLRIMICVEGELYSPCTLTFYPWRMNCIEGELFIVPVLQFFYPWRTIFSPSTPNFMSMEDELYWGRMTFVPVLQFVCPWRMNCIEYTVNTLEFMMRWSFYVWPFNLCLHVKFVPHLSHWTLEFRLWLFLCNYLHVFVFDIQ